jgi:L-ascorbate metabolism protein UlaG (beta-lactamase superfamily)
MRKHFGGKITEAHIEQYAKSANWQDSKFVNLEETKMEFSFRKLPKLLYKGFFDKEGREPKQKLPIVPFDKEKFLIPSDKMKFIWYGHATLLMRMGGKTILVDPMFGPNAAPISPFPVKRFSDNTLNIIDDLPDIDLVLLTHDHYDHLDFDSIQKLRPKVKQYFVALGVARHLIQWGIDASLITEFDWWENKQFDNQMITFTPSRHFAGRGLRDRAKSLWGGWILKSETENIWFSGDGGYGKHFVEIGDKLGPFDFAFMECGQYNENWHQIHMYPEEGVQAAMDGKAKKVMPIHWGGFSLAQHRWTEPVDRFVAEADRKNLVWITPLKGQMVSLDKNHRNEMWWK